MMFHSKWLFALALAFSIQSGCAEEALAQYAPTRLKISKRFFPNSVFSKDALTGIKTARLIVEDFSSKRTAGRLGVTRSYLERIVQERLEKAGIRVIGQNEYTRQPIDQKNLLVLSADLLSDPNAAGHFATRATIALHQWVTMPKNKNVLIPVITWQSHHAIGLVSARRAKGNLARATEHITTGFVNSWKSAKLAR